MTFGKPFRAAPVKLGQFARAQEQRARMAQARRVRRLTLYAAMAIFVGGMVLTKPHALTTALHSIVPSSSSATKHALVSAYYRSCAAARAAGAAPISRGEPGYRGPLDADHDGVACEPYFGN